MQPKIIENYPKLRRPSLLLLLFLGHNYPSLCRIKKQEVSPAPVNSEGELKSRIKTAAQIFGVKLLSLK